MTATRPYSAARPPDEAFAELVRGIGTQFDADCVARPRLAPRPESPREAAHRLRVPAEAASTPPQTLKAAA